MNNPSIGILCWEEGHVPQGLLQLEELKGNSTNPETFNFPLKYSRIEGANLHTVLENPDPLVLDRMITECNKLIKMGIKAITTSCGFNAIFQKELVENVEVPIFTSSLLQIPLLQQLINYQSIGVITASKSLLTQEHFNQCGVQHLEKITIEGLDDCIEWQKIFNTPHEQINLEIIEKYILEKTKLLQKEKSVKGFILECTDLPPFANKIREETGLPVFDFVTMTNHIHQSLN
ncbi:MAG: glutamate racemase [Planctomycetota bacterium]|nr:MAG: glutamate racemase [Planctomycetota bacterium]